MQTMTRKAADNEYLHRDFHGALSCAIQYLEDEYGADAVREYLRTFALTFYAPLRDDLKRRGLIALKEHFERIYGIESGDVTIRHTGNELVIDVRTCPAVSHIRGLGLEPAELFHETTRTVNAALCEGTPYTAELHDYNPETGACRQVFRRRREGDRP